MQKPTAIVSLVLASIGPGATGQGEEIEWELIRPSMTGVPGDYTQTIFIDDDDSPWIGGYIPFWEEGGVGHFDGTNWRTLNNVDCPQIGSDIGAPRFNDIVKTDDGVMWIGTGRGLLRFDPSVEPWCVTKYTPGNSGIAGADVSNIDIAPDGTLWIACATWGGGTQGGLSHYDPATDTWESWDTSNGLPWWSGWDWVDYVAVQPNAGGDYTVWFGSREMGLTSYQQGLFIWYGSPTPPPVTPLPTGIPGRHAVNDRGELLLTTNQGLALRAPDGAYTIIGGYPAGLSSEVSIVEPVSGGRLLLGTYYADVFLWDGGWSYLGNWGSGNHTYALTEDSTGAFWAGGIGGSSKYENGRWQRHRLTNSGMISYFIEALAFAPNGDVAMNGNAGPGVGGFDIMHPDRTWTNANVATYGIGLDWPYPTDDVTALAYRSNGNLLFAPMFNGLHEFDGVQFRPLIAEPYDIEHIAVAGNGRGWASTGRGVAFMEDNDGLWGTQFLTADGVPVGDICGIEADPLDGDFVWIGAQFGLAHTDGVTWDQVPREDFGLDRDSTGYHIWAFDVAPDGTIWAASGLGLYHYDPSTGQVVETHDLTNSPLPSDDIHHVEVAHDGSVWISMFDQIFPYPGGVARLHDGEWTVWAASSSPLPHNQHWDLESRAIDGGFEVWVGTASEAVAVIRVTDGCAPDLTGDGQINTNDFFLFLSLYQAQDSRADFTGDGAINTNDFFAFLSTYQAGCD